MNLVHLHYLKKECGSFSCHRTAFRLDPSSALVRRRSPSRTRKKRSRSTSRRPAQRKSPAHASPPLYVSLHSDQIATPFPSFSHLTAATTSPWTWRAMDCRLHHPTRTQPPPPSRSLAAAAIATNPGHGTAAAVLPLQTYHLAWRCGLTIVGKGRCVEAVDSGRGEDDGNFLG